MLGAAERSVLPFLASVFESVTPRAPLRRRHEVESVLNNFRYHCFAISSYPKLLLRYQFHSGVMGAVVTLPAKQDATATDTSGPAAVHVFFKIGEAPCLPSLQSNCSRPRLCRRSSNSVSVCLLLVQHIPVEGQVSVVASECWVSRTRAVTKPHPAISAR